MTKKKQINIRLSPAAQESLAFLVQKYGTKTAVIEIALQLLHIQVLGVDQLSRKTADAIIDKFHEISHPDYQVDFDWSMDEVTKFINSLVVADRTSKRAKK